MEELKKVIDCDNNNVLERFTEDQTETLLEKYVEMGKWAGVEINQNGDIEVWNVYVVS